MNEIQEYRKVSAEALEMITIDVPDKLPLMARQKNETTLYEWCPDTNLDQMGMIIKHLQKNGVMIALFYEEGCECWVRMVEEEIDTRFESFCTDMPIAFMKAFMEYIKKS